MNFDKIRNLLLIAYCISKPNNDKIDIINGRYKPHVYIVYMRKEYYLNRCFETGHSMKLCIKSLNTNLYWTHLLFITYIPYIRMYKGEHINFF